MGNDELTRAAALFRAMGHPIRLGVLERLRQEGEICACDFTEHFGVSQPTISGHLRTLREAGLVRTRRDGTQICYSLAPDALEAVRRMSAALCAAE
ncbi:metalloregulator ArsR/SmtB family transcription factor [Saccharopolyspora hirsuta]|uniref:Helix-turn-helix transcriptional regulator n=1 Tax=Saccharopolyspora hirsuta TaxID=1837 RepID=A0A5M7BNE6_SACHI|nr:metalloregulator ArsR/SmtB family transcription factor [Saccharopolyspora hirsuta]KAA5828681.1 helix-turn-helix transcriptional regulator [Saccharopolyspora hirsuta]